MTKPLPTADEIERQVSDLRDYAAGAALAHMNVEPILKAASTLASLLEQLNRKDEALAAACADLPPWHPSHSALAKPSGGQHE